MFYFRIFYRITLNVVLSDEVLMSIQAQRKGLTSSYYTLVFAVHGLVQFAASPILGRYVSLIFHIFFNPFILGLIMRNFNLQWMTFE